MYFHSFLLQLQNIAYMIVLVCSVRCQRVKMGDAMSMVQLTSGIKRKKRWISSNSWLFRQLLLSRKIQIVILVKPVADCIDSYILTRKERLILTSFIILLLLYFRLVYFVMLFIDYLFIILKTFVFFMDYNKNFTKQTLSQSDILL